jgi:regulator of protease activity HflC (stomatin/prohibitin superfamily)
MAAFAFTSSLNRVAHMTAAYTGVDGALHVNMAVARANYRDGLVSGLKKAVQEEQQERVRAAKEQDRLRQLEVQARREAKLAKARAEQAVIDAAAAAAGIHASEIRRVADATFSDDDDDISEAAGDRMWQAKSEGQAAKKEKSESQALTVLHVKCEEVAQEVRLWRS